MVVSASVQQLPLTPEEYFVLSRIDGTPTISEVIQVSGMTSGQVEGIVEKLIRLGALGRANSKEFSKKKRLSVNKPHQNRAKERKLGLLKAQFASAASQREHDAKVENSCEKPTKDSQTVESKPRDQNRRQDAECKTEESSSSSKSAESEPQPEPSTETAYVFIDPVPISDSRIDRALDMTVEDQRQVLAVCDRLSELTHFESLSLAPTKDAKQIRRAYYRFSRKFHPDNYYGKNIGQFQSHMESVFMQAREAYEVLMNDHARLEYYELCMRNDEQASAEKDLGSGSERHQQKQAELRAVAALRRKQANMSRLANRPSRSRSSTSSPQNRQKADEHFKSGIVEKEAGRLAAAAGMFRLALELVPEDESYHRMWQETLAQAQYERANSSFASGVQQQELGDLEAAKWLFEEAAKANPTPKHLAVAARYIAEKDLAKAHQMAISALNGLVIASKANSALSVEDQCIIHVSCSRVFIVAGQWHSAREQLDHAENLCPDHDDVISLRKSFGSKSTG